MTLVLRNVKGSPLTYNELDSNFSYLEGIISAGTFGLEVVLGVGNETDGSDLIISSGDSLIIDGDIKATSAIKLIESSNIVGSFANTGVTIDTGFLTLDASLNLDINANNSFFDVLNSSSFTAPTFSISGTSTSISGTTSLNLNGALINIANGTNEIIKSAVGSFNVGNTDKQSVIISSNNSSLVTGANSAIIGGTGISATKNDTVYIPSLVVQATKGIQYGSGPEQLRLQLPITNWNMYAAGGGSGTLTYPLAHGLTATQWKTIRDISIIVRDDNDTTYYDDSFPHGASANSLGVASFDSTNINLAVRSTSSFDSSSFDSTGGFVRGWVTLTYTY